MGTEPAGAPAAALRRREGDFGDALDFGDRVGFRVEGAHDAVFGDAALGFAEVDPASQFTHDHHVEAPRRDVGAKGRHRLEPRIEAPRAQVRVELVAFAKRQEGARFRTVLVREMVPLGAAHASEQNGFGLVAGGERRFGKGRAAGVDCGASDERLFGFEREAVELSGALENLERLRHDFGADAVTGEYGDAMGTGHLQCPSNQSV